MTGRVCWMMGILAHHPSLCSVWLNLCMGVWETCLNGVQAALEGANMTPNQYQLITTERQVVETL